MTKNKQYLYMPIWYPGLSRTKQYKPSNVINAISNKLSIYNNVIIPFYKLYYGNVLNKLAHPFIVIIIIFFI